MTDHKDATARPKVPPYDTGKLKIGIHYIPDSRPPLTLLEERLQESYLGRPADNRIEHWLDQYSRIAPYAIAIAIVFFLAIVEFIERH